MRKAEQVISKICEVRNVSQSQLVSGTRLRRVSDTRKMVSAVLRPRMTLVDLGDHLGGQHHATVLYQLKEHARLNDFDEVYQREFAEVLGALEFGGYL